MSELTVPEFQYKAIVPEIKQAGNDEKDGIIRFTFIDSMIDRGHQSLSMEGMKYDDLKNNPVFLWQHDMGAMFGSSIPAIGNLMMDELNVKKNSAEVPAKFDLDDPFAAQIYGKYQRKVMRGVSIGWFPLKPPELKVKGKSDDTANEYLFFPEWEWAELSAVNLPMNPRALSKNFGVYQEQMMKDFLDQFRKSIQEILTPHLITKHNDEPDELVKVSLHEGNEDIVRAYNIAKKLVTSLEEIMGEPETDEQIKFNQEVVKEIISPFREIHSALMH